MVRFLLFWRFFAFSLERVFEETEVDDDDVSSASAAFSFFSIILSIATISDFVNSGDSVTSTASDELVAEEDEDEDEDDFFI